MPSLPHCLVGANPIIWSNDDFDDLAGDVPLDTILREMRAAGYAGTELGHAYPRTPAALAEAKQVSGVRLIYVQVPAEVRLPGYSWWDVPVSGTSKVSGVRNARATYARAVKKQRFHY